MQETDPFLTNNDGTREKIHCKYFRDEVSIPQSDNQSCSWKVDGIEKGSKKMKFKSLKTHIKLTLNSLY